MQSPEVKNQLIDRMLSKDHTLRNIQIGMIVGMLSLEEFTSYAKYQREYNRRMIQMLKKKVSRQSLKTKPPLKCDGFNNQPKLLNSDRITFYTVIHTVGSHNVKFLPLSSCL